MKIFISADIEGIAGVMRPEQCTPGNPEYQLARGLMEQEVNAAIEGRSREAQRRWSLQTAMRK